MRRLLYEFSLTYHWVTVLDFVTWLLPICIGFIAISALYFIRVYTHIPCILLSKPHYDTTKPV